MDFENGIVAAVPFFLPKWQGNLPDFCERDCPSWHP
jgi:hypothetical protein